MGGRTSTQTLASNETTDKDNCNTDASVISREGRSRGVEY
ncbi:hypothetical protein CKA32_004948 [Geitlerinema sp. FC II]|nr:hypothetical protein CKA32_004948 [Geitlerinema sp. FC II]